MAFADKLVAVMNEKIELTKQTKEEAIVYYGIVLFGDWKKVSALTKKFSLWK